MHCRVVCLASLALKGRPWSRLTIKAGATPCHVSDPTSDDGGSVWCVVLCMVHTRNDKLDTNLHAFVAETFIDTYVVATCRY